MKHGPYLLTLKKRIQAFETKCMRKLLRIPYLEHKTNDWVRSTTTFLVGSQKPFLATVKRRKLRWFGHVTRYDSLSKTMVRAPWRVGDAVVGRGNAGWTTSKSGHPWPGLLQKRLEEDLCWIVPHVPHRRPNRSKHWTVPLENPTSSSERGLLFVYSALRHVLLEFRLSMCSKACLNCTFTFWMRTQARALSANRLDSQYEQR